jgi:SpoVK/Ycf46/Vps4 family AAA+-type ATPase
VQVSIQSLADHTEGYSGADITEICQRAAKLAIRECVEAELQRAAAVEAGEVEEGAPFEDPVPAITKVGQYACVHVCPCDWQSCGHRCLGLYACQCVSGR